MESNELSNKMIESIISDENVQEIFTDLTDFSFDQILDSPLNEFPIIKNFISVAKFGISVRDKFLINKILRFLKYLPKNNDESRAKFKNKIQSDPEYSKKIGEHLIIILDRYDHLTKAEYLSKIFSAYLNEKINQQSFMRLSTAIEKVFIEDLNNLDSYYKKNLVEVDEYILQNLYQAGLVGFSFSRIQSEIDKMLAHSFYYVKNDFGVLLCNVINDSFNNSKLIAPMLNDLENKLLERICIEEDVNRDYSDMDGIIERTQTAFNLSPDSLSSIISKLLKNGLLENTEMNAAGHYLSFYSSYIGYNYYFQKLDNKRSLLVTVINSLLSGELIETSDYSLTRNLSKRQVEHSLLYLQNENLVTLNEHSFGYLISSTNVDDLRGFIKNFV
ncbi:MAG TPA: hypothetical protein DHV28_00320 [Ignavibacteriales bacterium]|nr:hypothetical protein [Ignavibacteriales bacterium]